MLCVVVRAAPEEERPSTFSGEVILPTTGRATVTLGFTDGKSGPIEHLHRLGVSDRELRRILCERFGGQGWYFSIMRWRGKRPRGGDHKAAEHTWRP